MFIDILQTFCQYTGYDPAKGRLAASNYINRAAKDLYNSLEADALLRETVLLVPNGTQISLPPWIGELRGLREYNWSTTVPLNEIGVPRFSSDTQKFRWRNWTLKGKRPLAASIQNASTITLMTVAVETAPAIVVINGRTSASQAIVETVVMDATTKVSLNSFAEIRSITSVSNRTYDIAFFDVMGNGLGVLYNNEQKSEYIICDVSTFSWIAQVGDGATSIMEVLYKTKFYSLKNDTDEFPAAGYDDAIAYKAVVLWTIGKEEKESLALTMNAFAKTVIDSNVENAEKGQVRTIQHGNNPVYRVYSRLRTAYNWRQGQYYGRNW